MLTFRVDFNDQTDDGQIVALLRLASSAKMPPRVGDRAALRDAEGNRAEGRVVRVDGALAYLQPAWETWSPAEDVVHPKRVTVVFRQLEPKCWRADSPDAPSLVTAITGETRELLKARIYEHLRHVASGTQIAPEIDMPPREPVAEGGPLGWPRGTFAKLPEYPKPA